MNYTAVIASNYSRVASTYHSYVISVSDKLQGHLYTSIALESLAMLNSILVASRSARKFTWSSEFCVIGTTLVCYLGLVQLGRQCEKLENRSRFIRISRAILNKSKIIWNVVALLGMATLFGYAKWVELAALIATFALRQLSQRGILPVSPFKLDIAFKAVYLTISSIANPLNLSNFSIALEFLSLYLTKRLRKQFEAYVQVGQTPPRGKSSAEFSLSRFGGISAHSRSLVDLLSQPRSQLLRRTSFNRKEIRPYFPPLANPETPIEELKSMFYAIDWHAQQHVIVARLNKDAKFQHTEALENQASKPTSRWLTIDEFERCPEWKFFHESFDRLIDEIVSKKMETNSQATQSEMEYYCRFIHQECTRLLHNDPLTVIDQMVHLAVAGGDYCHTGKFVVLSEVFKTLASQVSDLAMSLDMSIARALYLNRETLFTKVYGMTSHYLKVANHLGFDFTNVHNFHMFKAIFAMDFGLNPAGSFEDLELEALALTYYLYQRKMLQKSSAAFLNPQHVIKVVNQAIDEREISMVAIFDWMKETIETNAQGEEQERLLDELSDLHPKFYGILIHPMQFFSADVDPTKINEEILNCLLWERGFFEEKREGFLSIVHEQILEFIQAALRDVGHLIQVPLRVFELAIARAKSCAGNA